VADTQGNPVLPPAAAAQFTGLFPFALDFLFAYFNYEMGQL
jgi:hypothetical protein